MGLAGRKRDVELGLASSFHSHCEGASNGSTTLGRGCCEKTSNGSTTNSRGCCDEW
uniref:Uncharacterized protein n=1 Tax=Aegilops tauschii TaxID=37682 RepID=M8BWS1_AEGTA